MFKSKAFTTAFGILSAIILVLSGILIYLLVGQGNGTGPILPTTPAPVVLNYDAANLRTLTANDHHTFPVMQEVIEESGTIEIVGNGKSEGVVFHARPQFDSRDVSDNVVQYAGVYMVVGKIYIFDDGEPYLMYKTKSGYYVTSSEEYIHYEPKSVCISQKIPPRTYTDKKGYTLTVHQADRNHMVVSLELVANGKEYILFRHAVVSFNADKEGTFEYLDGGVVYNGIFTIVGDGSALTIHLDLSNTINRQEFMLEKLVVQ